MLCISLVLSCIGAQGYAQSEILVPESAAPPYLPPVGEHPRVYFRKCDIPQILENMENEENAYAKERFLEICKQELSAGEVYVGGILQRIMAKAFYYSLFGNEKYGREAIEATLKTAVWTDIGEATDSTRRYGACIETLAVTYDWCYDLLTEEEKERMIDIATEWAKCMEIGWPPKKQGSLVGHGAEAQLLRDELAFAIATFDERPDFWNYIGGKFYEKYVPERQWHLKSQINHQGNDYGSYRNLYSGYAWLLIVGMGAPEPYSGYDVGTHAYSHKIYARRPDGMLFFNGDMYETEQMNYNHGGVEECLIEVACSKDPLVKGELFRVSRDATKDGNFKSDQMVGTVRWLLFNQPQVKHSSRESMPLSYYFGSPMGVMYARTGWQEGIEAPVAIAEMKVGEYWFGNHQHKDAGSFQLYYKGPLATDSGIYMDGVTYGSPDHNNYTMQSVAHNTILVYDPNEEKLDFANNQVNDGGQRWPMGVMQTNYNNIISDPQHHRASVEAEEIDPENPMKPQYSYLKGDITNAYSDKVSEFKRSFMFLNFEDEKIPAALIVFDKLAVLDADFEKAWLLHGQSRPEIGGSRIVWRSNEFKKEDSSKRYTGKMVQDILLPQKGSFKLNLASDEVQGWNTVRGVDYTHPQKSATREENTYRLEISPSENERLNYFLNVMQVTDEGNEEYFVPELIETDDFYGVKISDRVVLFSKTGKKVSPKTAFKTEKGLKYIICDIKPGVYQLSSSENVWCENVSDGGGVLSFTAQGSETAFEITEMAAKENEEIRIPSPEQTVIVKLDGNLVGLCVRPEIINGKLMVSANDLADAMGLKASEIDGGYAYVDDKQKIGVIVKLNEKNMYVNDVPAELTNESYFRDGEPIVELRTFAEAFNCIVNWDVTSFGAYVISDPPIDINAEKLGLHVAESHEEVKKKADVFVEAETAFEIGSGSVYDSRKFMSGGAGITKHDTEGTSLKYKVEIPEDGDYRVALKYVAWLDDGALRVLEMDGKKHQLALPKTDSWGADPLDWRAVVSDETIHLNAGIYEMSITAIKNMWNLDWIAFIKK